MTGFKGIKRNWILKALIVVLSCFLKIKIAKKPTEDIIPRGNMLLYINCNTKPQMIVKLRKTMLKEGDEQSHYWHYWQGFFFLSPSFWPAYLSLTSFMSSPFYFSHAFFFFDIFLPIFPQIISHCFCNFWSFPQKHKCFCSIQTSFLSPHVAFAILILISIHFFCQSHLPRLLLWVLLARHPPVLAYTFSLIPPSLCFLHNSLTNLSCLASFHHFSWPLAFWKTVDF